MIPHAVPPAVDWSDVTYSPAPTRRIEMVYQRLNIQTSLDPDIVVTANDIQLPDQINLPANRKGVVLTYSFVNKKTGKGFVVVGPKANRWDIAAALFAVGIR